MESKSDNLGNVAVSINPEETVNITTQNKQTVMAKIIAISEDRANVITASGEAIKISEITNITPVVAQLSSRAFFGGIAGDAAVLGATIAGADGKNKNPPLTFTYINGIKVPVAARV